MTIVETDARKRTETFTGWLCPDVKCRRIEDHPFECRRCGVKAIRIEEFRCRGCGLVSDRPDPVEDHDCPVGS